MRDSRATAWLKWSAPVATAAAIMAPAEVPTMMSKGDVRVVLERRIWSWAMAFNTPTW